MGQLKLYWGADSVGQLLIHGLLHRTKMNRDPPMVEIAHGVVEKQAVCDMWLSYDERHLDRSPAHCMLVYLLARGAWPGVFPAGELELRYRPPTTSAEWVETVESVLRRKPQSVWFKLRDAPVFVSAPPGPDEHLGGVHAVPWLGVDKASECVQASGVAIGANPKTLSGYSCRKSYATAVVNGDVSVNIVKAVATTLQHIDLSTTFRHYVDMTYPMDSFNMVHRDRLRTNLPGPSGRMAQRITHESDLSFEERAGRPEDDAWAEALVDTDASKYIQSMVLGVYGDDAGRV
eukprot:gene3741-4002_t